MQREHNPVWPLYDEIRTARLNKKVFAFSIRLLESRIRAMEIVIGVATSSSIAGLWFIQTVWGAWFWKALGVLGVFMMVLKPILKLHEEKEAKDALLIAYGLFEDELMDVSREVQTRQSYDDELKARFRRAMTKKKDLIESHAGIGGQLVRKDIESLQAEVEEEFPSNHFYLPPI